MNQEVIRSIANKGTIVIAVGGGGVPVYKHDNGYLEAIEAVIDKDLASSVLAKEIGADKFYIVTDVPKVYINFNKKDQKELGKIKVGEIKKYLDTGEFGSGSMEPKIKAAINFCVSTNNESIITNEESLPIPECGTRISL